MTKLRKVLKGISYQQIKGSKEVEISGISANSKEIAPGNLFVAKKGLTYDGARFIPEAIAAGAVAVVTDFFDPTLKGITQVIHPDVGAIEGLLAANFYDLDNDSLFLVGVTGTNGKTTTAFLVHHLLGEKCGLIGTIEYIIGSMRYQAMRTTPDLFTNHKLLKEMQRQGCTSAVMEVSSHALAQGRVQGLEFDCALFTNLTLDHLDYHETMEAYACAKNLLFRSLKRDKWAIVNGDSPYAERVLEGCTASVLRYGIEKGADLQAKEIVLSFAGTYFTASYRGEEVRMFSPLIGRFNVYNALCALAVALTKGVILKELVGRVACFPSVSGRLEPVTNPLGLKIFVDFAHSDDALKNVLETLAECRAKRILTVFGCGGDRDFSKRPKMAAVSEQLSTFSIVTSDNPRSEDPEKIAEEVVKGFAKRESYLVKLDRREAIKRAIELATEEDIILIAGKGHEKMQIFAHETVEFDDCKVALELCRKKICSSCV